MKGNYHRMSTVHGNTHNAHLDETFFINKMNSMQEKISKIEEKLKANGMYSDSSLPRINSSTNIATSKGGNTPSFDLLKKDIQKTNEELMKTN